MDSRQAIRRIVLAALVSGALSSCANSLAQVNSATSNPAQEIPSDHPFLVVLGIAQDGGLPHVGCRQPCCQGAWTDPQLEQHVSSIGLVDPQAKQRWIFDATPDFRKQLTLLAGFTKWDAADEQNKRTPLSGVLLTHAHIGHYTGLMYLGRESMGARHVPVYAMPRMRTFLSNNGPWSQLVELENINVRPLEAAEEMGLNQCISVKPLPVPHRDEYSETVGFVIQGPRRSALFLPDIDKWDRWDTKIESLIGAVDVALLDGTFYDNKELPNRDMSEIPHPFIVESIERFASLSATQRGKIWFIHLNHSNPAIRTTSGAAQHIRDSGHHVARPGQVIPL